MKSQADVFINRELSWIEFNKRVLLTGMEKDYKILDKVKFCSIFSNNLDEFFMVRVASLKAQVEAPKENATINIYSAVSFLAVGAGLITPTLRAVSYTHLTLPTRCLV